MSNVVNTFIARRNAVMQYDREELVLQWVELHLSEHWLAMRCGRYKRFTVGWDENDDLVLTVFVRVRGGFNSCTRTVRYCFLQNSENRWRTGIARLLKDMRASCREGNLW